MRRLLLSLACLLATTGVALANHGWQGRYTYSVPTGTGSLEFTYPCPANFPIAWNGGWENVGSAQTDDVRVTANGPRLDEGSGTGFDAWAWHFYWPSGSPAGTQIYFSVFCELNQNQ